MDRQTYRYKRQVSYAYVYMHIYIYYSHMSLCLGIKDKRLHVIFGSYLSVRGLSHFKIIFLSGRAKWHIHCVQTDPRGSHSHNMVQSVLFSIAVAYNKYQNSISIYHNMIYIYIQQQMWINHNNLTWYIQKALQYNLAQYL